MQTSDYKITKAGLFSNGEEGALHIPAEAGIQVDRMVLPDRVEVEESRILHTAAEEADRILVAVVAGHSPAVEVDRSLVDHHILVVVGSHPGADRTVVLGHSHRRSLLLERGEPVIFRLLCRRKSQSLRA